jgi:hypothetical protein
LQQVQRPVFVLHAASKRAAVVRTKILELQSAKQQSNCAYACFLLYVIAGNVHREFVEVKHESTQRKCWDLVNH